jgi:hypothetical protein
METKKACAINVAPMAGWISANSDKGRGARAPLARRDIECPFSKFTHVLCYIGSTSQHFRLSPNSKIQQREKTYQATSYLVFIRRRPSPACHYSFSFLTLMKYRNDT